ncbi:MAG: electron transport complex subunit E [Atopobiaceae bacterium]|nr:electron transport complex subunit E [Atopobiaceae bacterium]MBR3313553.1 electron transport complex subunit E [Atopobiaceae bacterium]
MSKEAALTPGKGHAPEADAPVTEAGATSWKAEFSKGLLAENPALRQMLGLCPTLAVTTAVTNGIGMGLATTFVLVCSEVVVSLLRKVIPGSVRIPAFITIIASFVTLTMMLVKAYLPALDEALGIYLPLIVVNCIVLGRAEMFASKHGPALSALDGLGMGLGFTGSLVLMSAIRELLGAGTLLGFRVMPSFIEPMLIMITPAGGFAVLGVLIAISVWFERRGAEPEGRPAGEPSDTLCAACPLNCGVNDPNRVNCADGSLAEQLRRFEERVERGLAEKNDVGGDV